MLRSPYFTSLSLTEKLSHQLSPGWGTKILLRFRGTSTGTLLSWEHLEMRNLFQELLKPHGLLQKTGQRESWGEEKHKMCPQTLRGAGGHMELTQSFSPPQNRAWGCSGCCQSNSSSSAASPGREVLL